MFVRWVNLPVCKDKQLDYSQFLQALRRFEDIPEEEKVRRQSSRHVDAIYRRHHPENTFVAFLLNSKTKLQLLYDVEVIRSDSVVLGPRIYPSFSIPAFACRGSGPVFWVSRSPSASYVCTRKPLRSPHFHFGMNSPFIAEMLSKSHDTTAIDPAAVPLPPSVCNVVTIPRALICHELRVAGFCALR